MWVVFEDEDNSELSDLLKMVYIKCGIKVGFANGCGNLASYVMDNCKNDKTIVYHDLVPDNPDTAISYKRLHTKLRHYSNVIIVPVVCTEFCVLKGFMSVPTLTKVVSMSKYPDRVKSAEGYYKYLLGTQVPICKSTGKYKMNETGAGSYYTCTCPCGKIDCNFKLDLYSKSITANRGFPVVPMIQDLAPFSDKAVSTIKREYELQHNRLVNIAAKNHNWSKSRVDRATLFDITEDT